MKKRMDEQMLARRVAKEFRDGMVINLGYGMPALCAGFIPKGRTVFFHGENGVLGYGPPSLDEKKDYELIDSSDRPVTALPGMCFFDSAESFDMIRGGHIDLVVLGAYQVSGTGDLANWGRPGRPATGMGGGMDLAAGSKQLIVMMLHTTKEGAPRIVRQCTFPLTAKNCVDKVFTDLAAIEVTNQGLVLREVASGWSAEEVQALTEPQLIVADDLKEIEP
jgi:3-oxoacid CoA-transferase subunit B